MTLGSVFDVPSIAASTQGTTCRLRSRPDWPREAADRRPLETSIVFPRRATYNDDRREFRSSVGDARFGDASDPCDGLNRSVQTTIESRGGTRSRNESREKKENRCGCKAIKKADSSQVFFSRMTRDVAYRSVEANGIANILPNRMSRSTGDRKKMRVARLKIALRWILRDQAESAGESEAALGEMNREGSMGCSLGTRPGRAISMGTSRL